MTRPFPVLLRHGAIQCTKVPPEGKISGVGIMTNHHRVIRGVGGVAPRNKGRVSYMIMNRHPCHHRAMRQQ